MATIQITGYLLECNGCKALFGGDGIVGSSVMEVRAAAYAAGWRFPAKVGAKGSPSTRVSDVCPSCLPDWKPENWLHTGNHRAATQAEAMRLLGRTLRGGSKGRGVHGRAACYRRVGA